jgi:tRNA(adenine34) deaminase
MDDGDYMRRAVGLARQSENIPVGCVIVLNGRIVGEGHHEVRQRCDPTAHAAIVAIRRACEAVGEPHLPEATLYTTLQPCGLCTMAIIWAGIRRVIYGAERHQVHPMYFEDRHLDTMDFVREAYRADLEMTGGVFAAACAELYYGPEDDPPRRGRETP